MNKSLQTLDVNLRQTKTKSDLAKLRSSGFVPGILYGDIDKNISLSIKKTSLEKFLNSSNFMSTVINLSLEGKSYKVLPRDIEFDSLSNQPLHVDFQTLSSNTKVQVWIPVKFLNEEKCPGLKKGGVLNIVRRKVELNCPADNIPSELRVDLLEKDIGESIKISAIKLPENVKPTILDRDFTIASVAAPTIVAEPETPAEASTDEATAVEGAEAQPAEGETTKTDGKATKADPKKEDKKPADSAKSTDKKK